MTHKQINKIYKLITCVAVSAVMMQILYVFIQKASFAAWIPTLLLMAAGYGLQALYGRVTEPRAHSREDYSVETGYESAKSAFAPIKAALPLTLCAAAAVGAFFSGPALMRMLLKIGAILVYNDQSVIPFLFAIYVFVSLASGVVLWFYPAHRVISLRTMLTYFTLFLLSFLLCSVIGLGTDGMIIYLSVFTITSVIVLNQTHIQRRAADTLSAISNGARLYNVRLIAVMMLGVIVLLIIAASVLFGVSFFARLIFSVILGAYLRRRAGDSYDVDVSDDGEGSLGRLVFEGQTIGERFFIVLFVILFIGSIVFLILRGTDYVRRAVAAVKEWFRELFMYIMDLFSFYYGQREMEYEFTNYKDEEISLQRASIREFETRAERTRSYREFLSALNSQPNMKKQIQYAYVTMCEAYRAQGLTVKKTDTPRQTSAVISSRTSDHMIGEITDVLETVDYADQTVEEGRGQDAIESMCAVISSHLEP